MENFKALVEAIDELKQKGYTADLSFEADTYCLYGGDLDMRLDPEDFHVDEIDRVGIDAVSDDGAVVYAITSITGIKGVIIDHL